MRRETDTIDDLKHDATDRLNPSAMRDLGRGAPSASVLVNGTVQGDTSRPKRSLSDRFKSLLAKLDKALEGDHEFHNHLGM